MATKSNKYTGLSSLGMPGVPWYPQILADQLTLSQPRGTNYAHQIILATTDFQTFHRPWIIHTYYKMTISKLHKDFIMTARPLPDHCLTTAWRLPDYCLATAWQLPDNCFLNVGRFTAMAALAFILIQNWLTEGASNLRQLQTDRYMCSKSVLVFGPWNTWLISSWEKNNVVTSWANAHISWANSWKPTQIQRSI